MTTWDDTKRRSNIAKHGVDLALAQDFEFGAALVIEDADQAYGEQRFVALGPIGDRLYVYVYIVDSEGIEDRAISLRPAGPKERRRYAREI